MYPVEETELAGIGKRFVVVTDAGNRLVIVVHESGTVELYQTARDDPERTLDVATLTDDEARLVAAIIGRTIYRPEAIERLGKHGIAIRWHTLKAHSSAIGRTLGEVLLNTGVVALAVVEKDGKGQPSPRGDYLLREGSQVALSGNRRDIEKVEGLLEKTR